MKILYLTDINYIGKFPEDFSAGYRPFMSWVPALDAFHCNYFQIDKLDINEKFDIAIIGSLNSTLMHPHINLKKDILSKIKKLANKIVFQQESYHRSFIHDVGLSNKTDIHVLDYYEFISECDAILTHNEIDVNYFSTLFNKPSFVHPQFILPLEVDQVVDINKPTNFILSSFDPIKDKGGSLDSYYLLKEFNSPIYYFSNTNLNLPSLHNISPDFDYVKFNQTLTNFKIGVNVPYLPIGGSFPLQCAMMKLPCVGWNLGNPQQDCFPELTSTYPDFNGLRKIIKKLLDNNDFYIEAAEKGYENFITKYSYDLYINQMSFILDKINSL
jgi:hypothetical protein